MKKPKRIIRDKVAADLILKVYANEGWPLREGEVRTRRINTLYDLSIDRARGCYVATRREEVK